MKQHIEILFEDAHLLVVDKPAGLLVVPTPRNEPRTLTSLLNAQRRGALPCHRLDRETSGCIVYAKDPRTRDLMAALFKQRSVKKRYVAFVQGTPGKAEATIALPIEGQAAQTRYRVRERRAGYSVVEAEPVTGRTNQIRIHFKQIGHPIVGDRKFSRAGDYALKFRRTALHAAALSFRHPVTGMQLSVEKEIPPDMAEFLGEHR
ncbi:MAG TPA: RluA family pseudouridine synthase [bacterium]|nr:RluA family pseudouridine synthase [bacterium]